MSRSVRFALAAGTLVAAASANAQVLATATFDDLAGSYTSSGPNTGAFVARAAAGGGLSSSGFVSRIDTPGANANFTPGFVADANPADIVITINTTLTSGSTGTGMGNFVITDVDGDTITGTIGGDWSTSGAGVLFFNGALSGVVLNDNGTLDNTFNGSDGGSFNMDLPGTGPYEGAIVQLTLSGSGFFSSNFSNRATGSTLQILPTPGALALLGLGGLVVGRRRGR